MTQHNLVQLIEKLITTMGYQCRDIELRQDPVTEGLIVNIRPSPADSRQLIGRDGDVIGALNYLVHKMVEHQTKPEDKLIQFSLDIDNYRNHQIDQIKLHARTAADRARSLQTSVPLPPMTSYERLIVHKILEGSPDIEVVSEGVDRERHIVIKYKGE